MTTDEAFDLALAAVEDLKQSGIATSVQDSCMRTEAEVVQQYSGPERVKPERWVNVSFNADNADQMKVIWTKQDELSALGIRFDSGGGCGGMDWELDWSFSYQPKK